MWHTGNVITVVRVDGSMTACQFPIGTILNVPTGSLMSKPKLQNAPGERPGATTKKETNAN